MARESAGLLMYRMGDKSVEVLLVHPGGPFWAKRSEGSWSIPKGEVESGDSPITVALREFQEELGIVPPREAVVSLGSIRQAGGKVVQAWTMSGDFDVTRLRSNTFQMEWPPRSGRISTFPEVDRAAWFDPETAERMILAGQKPFIARLLAILKDARAASNR